MYQNGIAAVQNHPGSEALAFQFGLEPSFGKVPVPSHRFFGDPDDMRGFFDAEAYKPAQFHHAGCARIDIFESRQGLIQEHEGLRLWGDQLERVVEFDMNLSAAPLASKIRACVVN